VRTSAHDLTKGEVAMLAIGGLKADVLHVNPDDDSSQIASITMRGKIYADCADRFSVRNTVIDSSLVLKKDIGFQISDKGGGMACVQKLRDEKKTCSQVSCVSISSLDGATMKLEDFGIDGSVKLFINNPEVDPELESMSIGGQSIEFKSRTTLEKEQERKEELARIARNEANEDAFQNCRSNAEELAIATRALNDLIHDTDMALDEIKARRAELAKAKKALEEKKVRAEFSQLKKKIAKAKDAEDAEELSDEIAQFASDHPEYAKPARQAQEDLIGVVADSMGDSPASYSTRKKIYSNLIDMLDGENPSEERNITMKMHGLDIAQMASMYQSGGVGNMNYASVMSNYQNAMRQAQKDYKSACQATKSNAMSDACVQSMKNMAAAQQLPAVAVTAYRQQLEQQRQEQMQMANMQMQMQQQMQQYMSSTLNMGNQAAQMPSFTGMMNTSNGFQNGFQNGFGQNNMGMNGPLNGPMNMMGGSRMF
jgi:hypothetical protein